MTNERYDYLNKVGRGLTLEEYREGWHFCLDWDLLLVGPGMTFEQSCCHCLDGDPK